MLFVSCTKYKEEEFITKTALGKSLDKWPEMYISMAVTPSAKLRTHIFYENTRGLSVCYNEAIERCKQMICWPVLADNTISKDPVYEHDIILFVHDDVSINDLFFLEKLEEGLKTFDILGLAGSSDFSINRSPIAWHNSPKDSWSGGVEHPQEPNLMYFNSFGPTPRRCLVIDGLFMAMNFNKLIESGVRFDEDFDFDFYDTSLCIRAILAGLKIGTTNIYCTHMSHGKGILKDRYKECEATFRQKYKGKRQ